jgi:hypothetical protein
MFWLIDYSFGYICQEKNANKNDHPGIRPYGCKFKVFEFTVESLKSGLVGRKSASC